MRVSIFQKSKYKTFNNEIQMIQIVQGLKRAVSLILCNRKT